MNTGRPLIVALHDLIERNESLRPTELDDDVAHAQYVTVQLLVTQLLLLKNLSEATAADAVRILKRIERAAAILAEQIQEISQCPPS